MSKLKTFKIKQNVTAKKYLLRERKTKGFKTIYVHQETKHCNAGYMEILSFIKLSCNWDLIDIDLIAIKYLLQMSINCNYNLLQMIWFHRS